MRPKHKLDEEILQKNIELKEEYAKLSANITSTEREINALADKKKSLAIDIDNISEQATKTAETIYKKSYALMQEKLEQSAKIESEKYQKEKEKAEEEYLNLLADNASKYYEDVQKREESIKAYDLQLNDIKTKFQTAIEAYKRLELQKNELLYYKIQISEEDKEDIRLLKKVSKNLNKDAEPINKIIWESYYKKPTMDLLGRLTPTGQTHIGIYKITNEQTGQCYIGQSADLRNRIRDHVKAGLGINSSNNRFYTEMKNIGPENFKFEILEECERSQLNEREKYWIEFFDSTGYGYNTSKGIN